MKKYISPLIKLGLSAAILGYLIAAACRQDAFAYLAQQFRDAGFDWVRLIGAGCCTAMAVISTFVRWWLLARAVEIPVSLRGALRLGFLGYFFNHAPLGVVGGDLVKALMLGHQYKRRARALASVMLDRVLGLYILFVVASAAIVLTGLYAHQSALIRSICITAIVITSAFTAAFACLFLPGPSSSRLTGSLGRLPYVGRPVERLVEAVLMYRNRPGTLALAMAISFVCQTFMVLAVYLLTLGIYRENVGRLSLPSMFVVLPLAESMGVIPLVAGPLEFVLNFLYKAVFDLGDRSQGLVVALASRFIALTIAAGGLGYYFSSRRELAQLVHEDEAQGQSEAHQSGADQSEAIQCEAKQSEAQKSEAQKSETQKSDALKSKAK